MYFKVKYQLAALWQGVTSLVAPQAKFPEKGKCKRNVITLVSFNIQYMHMKEKRMVYLDPLGIGAQSEATFRVAR